MLRFVYVCLLLFMCLLFCVYCVIRGLIRWPCGPSPQEINKINKKKFRHSWISPQDNWTSPPAAVYFCSHAAYTDLGFWIMLIFIPARSHTKANLSSACWRPCSEDESSTKSPSQSKRLILQFLTVIPSSTRLWCPSTSHRLWIKWWQHTPLSESNN